MRKISWFAVAAADSQLSNIAHWYNWQFSNTTGWYKVALCLRGRRGDRHQVAHSCACWKQSRRHLQRDPLHAPLLCWFEHQKPISGGDRAPSVHTEVIGHRTGAADRRPSTVCIVTKFEWR